MGSALGKAAESIGGAVGNAFVAPFKSIFGGSCQGVCSGPWDALCFLEHLCVSDLVKLLMILLLCYLSGDLAMHCQKSLQNVLGFIRSLLVCIGTYGLFLMSQDQEHEEGEPETKLAPFPRRRRRVQFEWRSFEFRIQQKEKIRQGGRLSSTRLSARRHHHRHHHHHHRRHQSNIYPRWRKRRKVKVSIYGDGSSRRGHVQQRKMRHGEAGEFKRQRLT